jgi:tellurite resistance protein
MTQSEEGKKLEALIMKAIDDLELTTREYDDIMDQANADGHIDPHERELLDKLERLVDEGIVKKVG